MNTNKEYIRKLIKEALGELQNKISNENIVKFLSKKNFINPNSKIFLFHGTKVQPEKFNLRDNYDWEDSNAWGDELPEGYLFLTTDIKEADAYGKYIIPCELKETKHIFFKINANNPSQVFDDDYNGRTNFEFWKKFELSGKKVLIIKGIKNYTVITDTNNVIPRIDLAKEFYSQKKKI